MHSSGRSVICSIFDGFAWSWSWLRRRSNIVSNSTINQCINVHSTLISAMYHFWISCNWKYDIRTYCVDHCGLNNCFSLQSSFVHLIELAIFSALEVILGPRHLRLPEHAVCFVLQINYVSIILYRTWLFRAYFDPWCLSLTLQTKQEG